MATAFALRHQIEASLADRIPSALTPAPKIIRHHAPTGIDSIDEALEGGFPLGAITELVGPECSGRTGLALSFLGKLTQTATVCAWVDVSDTLQPESTAAAGVDLSRLLWVRCGVHARADNTNFAPCCRLNESVFEAPPTKKGLHGGGFGPHPRTEAKGLSGAVNELFQSHSFNPRCAEPQRKPRPGVRVTTPRQFRATRREEHSISINPWARLDQALRATDLLLQAGGFSAVVLDMGSIAPEHALRVPTTTWFRYRAAAERTQACLLLLTQQMCAQSSAALVLELEACAQQKASTVFEGVQHQIEVLRKRFNQSSNVLPLKKPPQRQAIAWNTRSTWAGRS